MFENEVTQVITHQSIECGIPGYKMSALSMARYCQELAQKGEFAALRAILDQADVHAVNRMSLAIRTS